MKFKRKMDNVNQKKKNLNKADLGFPAKGRTKERLIRQYGPDCNFFYPFFFYYFPIFFFLFFVLYAIALWNIIKNCMTVSAEVVPLFFFIYILSSSS